MGATVCLHTLQSKEPETEGSSIVCLHTLQRRETEERLYQSSCWNLLKEAQRTQKECWTFKCYSDNDTMKETLEKVTVFLF